MDQRGTSSNGQFNNTSCCQEETTSSLKSCNDQQTEIFNLVSSVNWLSQHVPTCVLNRLGQEIRNPSDEVEHTIRRCSTPDEHLSDLSEDEDESDRSEEDILRRSERGVLCALREEEDNFSLDRSERADRTIHDSTSSRGEALDESRKTDISSSGEFHQRESRRSSSSDSSLPRDMYDRYARRLSSKLEYQHLPYASMHQCAMLYVDISGFTKLSKLLDPESLSEAINSYFHTIVDEVTSFGGDILKFAGDALFAEWQAVADPSEVIVDGIPHTVDPLTRMNIQECAAIAAACGASIVSKCSNFPVFPRKSTNVIDSMKQIATLNVHCGLGVGEVVGVHVGDSETRREYLVIGDPIKQSAEAANSAALGEFYASPNALQIMARRCRIDDKLISTNETKSVLIASQSVMRFTPRDPKMQRRCSVAHSWQEWDVESLQSYRKLISLYAHPVVSNTDAASLGTPPRGNRIQERDSEEAELRTVYTMFVHMPRVRARILKEPREDLRLFRLLNDIMRMVSRELMRFAGQMRQFLVDDKGLVLIATFGLKGSTFPNMVTERALPATKAIHNALSSELGVFNRIGATLGTAYCGLVGGRKRHEFAVLGPAVNLAARLMTNKSNPGILVDESIRMNAGKVHSFKALEPVEAKGFSVPVPIFEPLDTKERGWGKVNGIFVGRKAEIRKLVKLAKEISSSRNVKAKIVFVIAESGTGKTLMVNHAVEHIRRTMGKRRKHVLISKHACRESDRLVPFSLFRSIFLDILNEAHGGRDDTSVASHSIMSYQSGNSYNDSNSELLWDGLSVASSVSATSTVHASPDRFIALCREIDATPEFIELFGHHVLGIDMSSLADCGVDDVSSRKPSSSQTTVNLIVQAFLTCTRRMHLVVIAIDDVHRMDEMSWKALNKMFLTSLNLLIICTTQPVTEGKLTMEEHAWRDLNGKFATQHRFITMDLSSLGEDDMRCFLERELGIEHDDVNGSFYHDIFVRTGGMPQFANELLQDLRRRRITEKEEEKVEGWRDSIERETELNSSSVTEVILHRLDSLDPLVRNTLSVGAVLGGSFELVDIVKVLHDLDKCTPAQETDHTEKVIFSLNILVNESILKEVFEGGETSLNSSNGSFLPKNEDSPSNIENRVYIFCHDVWRKSVLEIMLDSRKKDIHRTIARTLETQDTDEYQFNVRLFSHWKEGGDFVRASSVCLRMGANLEVLGLHHQSFSLYEDALRIWMGETADCLSSTALNQRVLKSLSVSGVEASVRVLTAMGHCLANSHKSAESVAAYQKALEILQAAPAAQEICDRSMTFPLFSGLFVALKCGTIEQDDDCMYEQDLVRRFVSETRITGDPIHFSRALAMQAEMYARLGQFDEAFQVHGELEMVYDVEKHSEGISKSYGSDRAGQSFGASAMWHMHLGHKNEALRTSHYVTNELMPKMEQRNVHNSCIMLYPVIWVLKDQGRASEAREAFVKYVVDPFNEFFGEGSFTFCLPVFQPILMLLDLASPGNLGIDKYNEHLAWTLQEDNLRLGVVLNRSTGSLGRCADSITAEVCLLLAASPQKKPSAEAALVRNGLAIAREVDELTKAKNMVMAREQNKTLLEQLEGIASTLQRIEAKSCHSGVT